MGPETGSGKQFAQIQKNATFCTSVFDDFSSRGKHPRFGGVPWVPVWASLGGSPKPAQTWDSGLDRFQGTLETAPNRCSGPYPGIGSGTEVLGPEWRRIVDFQF